jgi:hypothetical protein
MTPEEIYTLRETDPAALARALARYDAAGIVALSQACSAYVAARDGVVFPAPLVRSAWQRAGLISEAQAGVGLAQAVGGARAAALYGEG